MIFVLHLNMPRQVPSFNLVPDKNCVTHLESNILITTFH